MDSRRVLVSLMADTLQTNSEGRGDLSHVKKGGQSRPPLPAAVDRRRNGRLLHYAGRGEQALALFARRDYA